MKRRKTIIILAAVLALVCVGIIVEQAVTRHVEEIQNSGDEILAVTPENLTQVSWTLADASLEFNQTDGIWYSADDDTFPVDQDKIADLLSNFASVHASFIIDDVDDYSQYGLSDPEGTIVFTTSDGSTTMTIGGYSTMDSKRYVQIDDGSVYLVEDDPMDVLSDQRDDYMQQDNIPDYDETDSVTSSGAATFEVVYDPDATSYSYSEDYDYYMKDGDDYKAVSTANISAYLSNLLYMDLSNYATYNASDEGLSKYGLDAPSLTITVTGAYDSDSDEENTDNTTYTLNFSLKDGDEDTVYMRKDDSEIIYIVDADTYTDLVGQSYDTLRPTEVLALDWEDVTSMDVTINDENYTFSHDSDDTYMLEGNEVDMADVTDAANAMTIEDFQDTDPTLPLELSVSIKLKNKQYPELDLSIYQYDGDDCMVVLNDENIGLMKRSQMVSLKEALTSVILGKAEEASTEE